MRNLTNGCSTAVCTAWRRAIQTIWKMYVPSSVDAAAALCKTGLHCFLIVHGDNVTEMKQAAAQLQETV